VTGALDSPLAEIAAAVGRREVSPTELVETALARIARGNAALNAIVHVDGSGARRAAVAVEDVLARGEATPVLAGIPFAVKESEQVSGWRSTFGDPAASARAPAPRDSLQVARLREAGAIPVAATNLALYGGWAETANPLFGTTSNPWDRRRIPGGSSGGSAAAIAAAMVPFATGSDGGGSLRIPAAACGIVGFKPTHGVVPEADTEPAWGTLAVQAPMARTVTDLITLLDVVCAASRESSKRVLPRSFATAAQATGVGGLRVAWSPTLGYATPDTRIVDVCAAAVRRLADAGAVVEEVSAVLDIDPVDIFAVPFLRALAADVRLLRGSAGVEDLDPVLASWMELATRISAADVSAAESARLHVCSRFAQLFARFDLLVTPTTAQPPPPIPHPDNEWVKFTHPFNLIDAPAISIPAGVLDEDGCTLPVGVQLAGPPRADAEVVACASVLERLLDLDLHPPFPPSTSTGDTVDH
jgi:aspartyl-tRNA(Asn)/glutamyl-tRNA(Gln) amidotransferase subunit A